MYLEEAVPLAAVLGLAFLCESLTEYFFADLLAAFKVDRKYLRYIAAMVGVGLCLIYGLDLIKDALGLSPRPTIAGEVFSGLVLGRGANYLHDFYRRFARPKTP